VALFRTGRSKKLATFRKSLVPKGVDAIGRKGDSTHGAIGSGHGMIVSACWQRRVADIGRNLGKWVIGFVSSLLSAFPGIEIVLNELI